MIINLRYLGLFMGMGVAFLILLRFLKRSLDESKSPPPLPSIPDSSTDALRGATGFGGIGDKSHLGGFTTLDEQGISYNTWNFMMGILGVKSLLDVGCGRGVSTEYFLRHGAKVLCVEGSNDAVAQSFLPRENIIQHDFSRGAWWPEDTYDAAWSVEFLEHVGRHNSKNYMKTFKKAALLFISASAVGGWHHVEVHADWWWKSKFEAAGFLFSDYLTELVRLQAMNEVEEEDRRVPSGDSERGQYVWSGMMVFINPAVASLPKHDHLFSGHGCFGGEVNNRDGGIPCLGVDAIPPAYQPLLECVQDKKLPSEKEWRERLWRCTRPGDPRPDPRVAYSVAHLGAVKDLLPPLARGRVAPVPPSPPSTISTTTSPKEGSVERSGDGGEGERNGVGTGGLRAGR